MHIQESGEMYLESILVLSQKKARVRSIDVVEYMGYSKPSVSRAVSLLKKGGFITMEEDGTLLLTDDGKEVAEKIFERHTLLTKLLIQLGVDEETATADACKLEHAISDTSFNAIKAYISSL